MKRLLDGRLAAIGRGPAAPLACGETPKQGGSMW